MLLSLMAALAITDVGTSGALANYFMLVATGTDASATCPSCFD